MSVFRFLWQELTIHVHDAAGRAAYETHDDLRRYVGPNGECLELEKPRPPMRPWRELSDRERLMWIGIAQRSFEAVSRCLGDIL